MGDYQIGFMCGCFEDQIIGMLTTIMRIVNTFGHKYDSESIRKKVQRNSKKNSFQEDITHYNPLKLQYTGNTQNNYKCKVVEGGVEDRSPKHLGKGKPRFTRAVNGQPVSGGRMKNGQDSLSAGSTPVKQDQDEKKHGTIVYDDSAQKNDGAQLQGRTGSAYEPAENSDFPPIKDNFGNTYYAKTKNEYEYITSMLAKSHGKENVKILANRYYRGLYFEDLTDVLSDKKHQEQTTEHAPLLQVS